MGTFTKIPTATICGLITLWICVTVGQRLQVSPRCETCKYTPGIDYLNYSFCGTYVKCAWDRDDPWHFSHELHCCNGREVFDPTTYPPGCSFPRDGQECEDRFFRCPPPAPSLCDFRPHRRDPTKYQVQLRGQGWVDLDCGAGTVWNQATCACIFAEQEETVCERLLDFDFETNILSTVCNLNEIGTMFGDPFIATGVICFSGYEQFFEIKYLMEYFSDSPRSAFTLSFFFTSADDFAHQSGLFSSNCLWRTHGSPVELYLEHSELIAILGHDPRPRRTGRYIDVGRWYQVAVRYLEGFYDIFLDGEIVFEYADITPLARSNTHATLGYVERDMFFSGCMDDFVFYTVALDDDQIQRSYLNHTRFY